MRYQRVISRTDSAGGDMGQVGLIRPKKECMTVLLFHLGVGVMSIYPQNPQVSELLHCQGSRMSFLLASLPESTSVPADVMVQGLFQNLAVLLCTSEPHWSVWSSLDKTPSPQQGCPLLSPPSHQPPATSPITALAESPSLCFLNLPCPPLPSTYGHTEPLHQGNASPVCPHSTTHLPETLLDSRKASDSFLISILCTCLSLYLI